MTKEIEINFIYIVVERRFVFLATDKKTLSRARSFSTHFTASMLECAFNDRVRLCGSQFTLIFGNMRVRTHFAFNLKMDIHFNILIEWYSCCCRREPFKRQPNNKKTEQQREMKGRQQEEKSQNHAHISLRINRIHIFRKCILLYADTPYRPIHALFIS